MILPRVNILGVGISTITMNEAVDQIQSWIAHDSRKYVSVCNVHTIMECQKSDVMRQAVNGAGIATPDGMPLVWLGRHFSKRVVKRVYGPDLMLAVCEQSVVSGYTHYFYGGAEGVPELLAARLKKQFPDLRVAGMYSPPFRPLTIVEEEKMIERLNTADPDIVWIGLGTPKQDLWMARYRDRLRARVFIAVGAAFDFHTGRIPQAPIWMQRSGLEWLYRLVQEPRRLWYRYLVYNPLFVARVLLQITGIKQYPLPEK
jgi:N-acetylglucosaminyldiphosphoundecaprenol N-acetyl-beta-D-mannosaminyltransferase